MLFMVQDTLEKTKETVWPEIRKYLEDPTYPSQFRIPKDYKKEVDLYWKINRDYPERKGKYLRPTLVLLTSRAMGTRASQALSTAAAMQLSEEWILIHDDIEDNSETRRGKPTLHKLHGAELAINAGDAVNTIMWKVINDLSSKEISDEFYRILMHTVLGQAVEQIWTNNKIKDITDKKYLFIADSKSAYYSIAGPMRLGAIVAGATSTQIDKITNFGLYLGRCFQLVDDILDIEQDKKEGKITLANTKGKKYTINLAKKMKDLARNIFDKELGFLSHEPARTELKELINFILEREY
ncbi:MAG: Polyprenyl synthetase [Candidatus Woesebacteria bacterium GW2011_GWA1_41_7]|uniref:Polyprenyl synthetase n=1 Tax=Candidatus Woesebacteria bacterium GW2011_GWA1_41_7 TaxID=1618556 RepID=A0A0G0ZT87_9BACT|nr:MAG: Polyprenyl synthetase [Candidatus Woesebacteria bacterium GW2011_GWA1_41_7]